MADVHFDVHHAFDASPDVVWRELIDWKGHEAWIPATRVEVGSGDPTAVGGEFTAWSGIGRLALEDRMRVTACDWHDEHQRGHCRVEKLGPILRGTADFTVEPHGSGSAVAWGEDVTVPFAPQFLAPILARLGAGGFALGMRKLDRLLRDRRALSRST